MANIPASNKYCVIMAGGIGSRFWPKSRQSMPKQFLDILGTGKSFIRHTYERFSKIVPPENFLVVTNRRYKGLVLEHLPESHAASIPKSAFYTCSRTFPRILNCAGY